MLARFGMGLLPKVVSGWIRRGRLCSWMVLAGTSSHPLSPFHKRASMAN
jgi:hypothetical protein